MDYSKWDHIDVSDDSDEEGSRGLPRVTKFEKPGVVNISKEGVSFTPQIESKNAPSKKPFTTTTSAATTSSSSSTNSAVKNGDESLLWRNGSKMDRFHWSQTQTEVTLRFPIPVNLAAKNTKILLLAGRDLTIKEINAKSSEVISFNGRFRYEVKVGDSVDTDTGEFSDWELLTLQDQRYLVLTFQKVSALAGAVFWWDRVFDGDPAIDVTAIEDRRGVRVKAPGEAEATNTAKTAASNVWEEAHRMFREKVANRHSRDHGGFS